MSPTAFSVQMPKSQLQAFLVPEKKKASVVIFGFDKKNI
jgi:hypothetical protein